MLDWLFVVGVCVVLFMIGVSIGQAIEPSGKNLLIFGLLDFLMALIIAIIADISFNMMAIMYIFLIPLGATLSVSIRVFKDNH